MPQTKVLNQGSQTQKPTRCQANKAKPTVRKQGVMESVMNYSKLTLASQLHPPVALRGM